MDTGGGARQDRDDPIPGASVFVARPRDAGGALREAGPASLCDAGPADFCDAGPASLSDAGPGRLAQAAEGPRCSGSAHREAQGSQERPGQHAARRRCTDRRGACAAVVDAAPAVLGDAAGGSSTSAGMSSNDVVQAGRRVRAQRAPRQHLPEDDGSPGVVPWALRRHPARLRHPLEEQPAGRAAAPRPRASARDRGTNSMATRSRASGQPVPDTLRAGKAEIALSVRRSILPHGSLRFSLEESRRRRGAKPAAWCPTASIARPRRLRAESAMLARPLAAALAVALLADVHDLLVEHNDIHGTGTNTGRRQQRRSRASRARTTPRPRLP